MELNPRGEIPDSDSAFESGPLVCQLGAPPNEGGVQAGTHLGCAQVRSDSDPGFESAIYFHSPEPLSEIGLSPSGARKNCRLETRIRVGTHLGTAQVRSDLYTDHFWRRPKLALVWFQLGCGILVGDSAPLLSHHFGSSLIPNVHISMCI